MSDICVYRDAFVLCGDWQALERLRAGTHFEAQTVEEESFNHKIKPCLITTVFLFYYLA